MNNLKSIAQIVSEIAEDEPDNISEFELQFYQEEYLDFVEKRLQNSPMDKEIAKYLARNCATIK